MEIHVTIVGVYDRIGQNHGDRKHAVVHWRNDLWSCYRSCVHLFLRYE